ncbi:MAG: isoaspartyl peptidase/L-asparaginase [Candidatus Bathyarchaeota archaeon]|jgi:beta-aspartyl-peptidase (threonine type)
MKPFIIGTHNSREMLRLGVEVLREGGSAIDAVEGATRAVEANPDDTSVGLGGIPNMLGVPQMDASIMDGKTLRSGAVAAVEGFLHPISIARRVMEVSPHVFLVGRGAEMFAEVEGFERGELLTERSRAAYEAFVKDTFDDLDEETQRRTNWARRYTRFKLHDWYEKLTEEQHGTVNIMAMDAEGNVCSAVSTSGTAYKMPGRVGDSPIIGAGNYCDNRFGAAACTGRGELAIRRSTARTIISYIENGRGLEEACIQAMRDIYALNEPGSMNCLAFDAEGNTFSASISRESIHWYMDIDSEVPEERKGIWVKG